MRIKKFNMEEDFTRVESYLRNLYLKNKNMKSWLPERFNDLVYRIDPQYLGNGKLASKDYIFLFEENDEIIGCILPDSDAIYISVQNGCEKYFGDFVKYAEENCRNLIKPEEDGKINFLVVVHDSDKYKIDYLTNSGYLKDIEEDYDNYIKPQEYEPKIWLNEGYRIAFGDEITDEYQKGWSCDAGFHPEIESDPNFVEKMFGYNGRKNSPMYHDSFECMVVKGDDICSYSFVYVDKLSKSAFIEPVSTREKYRRMGIGSSMMNAIAKRCKEMGIEKLYVNSYDWRRKFYNAAGFITEDSIGMWHKKI